MKKSWIYKIGTLTSIVLMVIACSDFLEVENTGQLSVEGFYETDQDAEEALISVYDILQWHNNSQGWASPLLLKTLPSDEGTAGGADAGDQPGYVALDRYTFDAASDKVLGVWTMQYYGVFRANLVINNTEADTEVKKQAIAEAKALRAYYYFELVSLFGDVPLILEELVPSEYDQPRTAVATVYGQIEKDLMEAIPDLPLKSAYSAANKFRMSKGTAQAFLGKAHLYQEEWGDAARLFDEVINSGEYALESDFGRIFSAEGEFGVESLLETSYVSSQGYDWGANPFPWGSTAAESNIHIQFMGPRENQFLTGVDSLNVGWGGNYPTKEMFQAFIDAGDTERRRHTVMSQSEFVANGGQFGSGVNPADDIFDYEGFVRRKYGSYATETDDEIVAQLNYATNWRLLRYADVLLMAAEAHNRNGNDARAMTELNKVRSRVGLSPVTAGGDALFDAIVKERRLELAFEGYRFLDLVRWNRADAVLGTEGFVTGKHELFPIPDSEIRRSPSLAPNNPGWN